MSLLHQSAYAIGFDVNITLTWGLNVSVSSAHIQLNHLRIGRLSRSTAECDRNLLGTNDAGISFSRCREHGQPIRLDD